MWLRLCFPANIRNKICKFWQFYCTILAFMLLFVEFWDKVEEKKEDTDMKKISQKPQAKHGIVNVANRCAFGLMVGSVNSACCWIHHQPKVPEAAMKYRKF